MSQNQKLSPDNSPLNPLWVCCDMSDPAGTSWLGAETVHMANNVTGVKLYSVTCKATLNIKITAGDMRSPMFQMYRELEFLQIHRDSNSSLGKIFLQSYRQQIDHVSLTGFTPITMLLEIGLDKMRKDYINYLIGTKTS
ncbi:hypothetical protein NHX12_003136 [Muraenolepis orangiensis]|uniref:Protein zwilch n=1 Tax=Muraenolepis orangiensis TaxID=630683 RepID=A0A9Q0E267_9TELE|nr:hypothetical protein NHX12_003136 [Muraenolepis orangiensis]